MMIPIMEQDKLNKRPLKFVLWLFILSILMLFAGLTSAYIVRKAEGNWTLFQFPQMFWYTTVAIALSSITLHWAFISAKKFDLAKQKLALWLTFVLGVLFLAGQYLGWVSLVEQGIFLAGNPSGSFLYVISGLHALHIVAGLLMIIAAILGVYKPINQTRNVFRMELTSIYWHFVDILWIYLFVFLLLNRQ